MNDRIRPARCWFRAGGALGVYDGSGWHDLRALLGDAATDVRARLADGTLSARGLDRLSARLSDATRLDAVPAFDVPVPHPAKILCLGKNYHAHAAEFGGAAPSEPMFFNKLPECLIADGEPIVLPPDVGRVDHEGELCLVIGRDGGNIPETEAASHVAGLTLINDVTARHIQGRDREKRFPWLRSKSFDTFGPCGPWVVPFDDVFGADVAADATPDLAIGTRVNGEPRQSSRTSLIVHRIAPVVAYLSRHTTLRAGDLIATGTPAGVSELHDGDSVEVWCERVGTLRNSVRVK